jgi:probable rRNA maturation factor
MITVSIQTESHYLINRKKIEEAVIGVLQHMVHRMTEVSVNIVGDRRMRQLNKTYRNLDATTDVLSFALTEHPDNTTQFIDPPDDVLHLGDIVVSYPQAVLEAAEGNKMVDDQVVFLVLHGLNHLLGIHHPE